MNDALVESLRRAIAALPGDVPLRVQLGWLLLESPAREAGGATEAVTLAAEALGLDPAHAGARELMTSALTPAAIHAPAAVAPAAVAPAAVAPAAVAPASSPSTSDHSTAETGSSSVPNDSPPHDSPPHDFDWDAAETQVDDLVEPMFIADNTDSEPDADHSRFSIEASSITLADVGGMVNVKERLTAAFLAPLRNPELRKLYGKSLRGGLLMYGPPGCGKTFIARAIAGELGAKFLSVSLADILDPYIGQSERNVKELFQIARREAPCVLFLDEIDALGQRRSSLSGSSGRGTVNQLLTELDGVDGTNEGVFVLAATNQPWDIDPALRRPGRLDRTVLVLPPDADARAAIFRYHLASRPVEGIDIGALVSASEGYSGADIAYVCEVAAERALTDSALSGTVRLISMRDVTTALGEVRPSTSPWLASARNVVMFGDDDGTYAELKLYLKKVKRL